MWKDRLSRCENQAPEMMPLFTKGVNNQIQQVNQVGGGINAVRKQSSQED